MKPYVIQNQNGTEYWSNDDGWVDITSATRFGEQEKVTVNLPMFGTWTTLWEVNSIQFARFIAECEACGVFTDEARLEEVAESMDLDIDEVFELVSRAQESWDDYKASI